MPPRHRLSAIFPKKDPASSSDAALTDILKDRPDTYHIFVYGDEYEKISRTQQLFNLSEKDARAINRDMDKKRRLHYEYYTDRKWGDPGNHCMCLNTSALDMERCIRYILDLFE